MNRFELTLKSGGRDAVHTLAAAASGHGVNTALVRQAVRDNPKSALALIALPSKESGLTSVGRGRVLDFVMAEFPPEEARVMVEEALLHEDRITILAAHGDLPHAAADVLAIDDVLAAMLQDALDVQARDDAGFLKDDSSDESLDELMRDSATLTMMLRCGVVKSWLYKLKDREDYDELLECAIDGDLTVRDMALVAIATENGVYGEEAFEMIDEDDPEPFGDDLTNDMFETLGINPDEARERLVVLFREGVLDEINEDMIHLAKAAIAKRHQRIDETPSVTREVAQEAAAIASASDL